jgi:hypothetical protein
MKGRKEEKAYIKEGMKEGRKEGKEGHQRKEGRKEGRKAGRKEGRKNLSDRTDFRHCKRNIDDRGISKKTRARVDGWRVEFVLQRESTRKGGVQRGGEYLETKTSIQKKKKRIRL